jgi:hypothetical protein
MSKFETAFKAAVADNERRILITTLRAAPDLTLGELHKLSKGMLGRLFAEITLGELINPGSAAPMSRKSGGGKTAGRGGRRKAGDKAAAPAGDKAAASAGDKAVAPAGEGEAAATGRKHRNGGGRAKAVNTRTPEGRAQYDEALFKALEAAGVPTGAGALIAKVGGTSLQARAGLTRLIEAGRITWSGKARGTRYSLA